jgi:hypothetical protein
MDNLTGKPIKYYAVVDNSENYFNGHVVYADAIEELENYRSQEVFDDCSEFIDNPRDPKDVLLVAVLDV